MIGKVTIRRSPLVLSHRWRFWPFGAKVLQEVNITGTVHLADGSTGDFSVTLPACAVEPVGISEFVAEAAEVRNVEMNWVPRSHDRRPEAN